MKERPKLLCKFRPWKMTCEKDGRTGQYVEHNRTKELLCSAQFYCQPPRFFDDPHDGLQGARATGSPHDFDRFILHNIGIDVLRVMHDNKFGSLTQLDQATKPADLSAIKRAGQKHTRRLTRVLSLSAAPTSELMWSFYGDNHKGICLCFDSQHPFFANAREVQYADGPGDIPESTDDDSTNDPLLYCKGRAWIWQQEWRLAWTGEDPKLISFPREALRAVMLGEWFHESGFDDLIETLKQGGFGCHSPLRILQMERVPDSFDYQVIHRGEIGPKNESEKNRDLP